jgi:hypothetical protein
VPLDHVGGAEDGLAAPLVDDHPEVTTESEDVGAFVGATASELARDDLTFVVPVVEIFAFGDVGA